MRSAFLSGGQFDDTAARACGLGGRIAARAACFDVTLQAVEHVAIEKSEITRCCASSCPGR